jgi:uncharacterized RDD family membrane protein YckC
MKRWLVFLSLVAIAVLAQLGFYHLLTVFGLRQDNELLLLLTIISGLAFWYFPFWYAFVYSKKQKLPSSDTES